VVFSFRKLLKSNSTNLGTINRLVLQRRYSKCFRQCSYRRSPNRYILCGSRGRRRRHVSLVVQTEGRRVSLAVLIAVVAVKGNCTLTRANDCVVQ
jgi:hypothetical protein